MGHVFIADLNDARQFDEVKAFFESENPDLRISTVTVSGDTCLTAQHGGMQVLWVYRGGGEVLLEKGYRTQEGDGWRLPASYRPDTIATSFAETLGLIRANLSSITSPAGGAVRSILQRWSGEHFAGDMAGDLWKLEHCARPWSAAQQVEAAIASLFGMYREQGYSTKKEGSYEPIVTGDQLIAAGDQELRVRGEFVCLSIENVKQHASHVSAARRLRYLVDSAGGCNPDFDPFRRLPLTWQANDPGESGDGVNWVNSHVVNIPKETSPTHFHPPRSIGVPGLPQREMYLVLDPKVWELNTWGRSASLTVFPNLRDLSQWEDVPLTPGMFVYIPPGTGHRGVDVFVNVLTVPGFKPHNEYYIDRDISESGRGAPYNESMPSLKNYSRIEDLL